MYPAFGSVLADTHRILHMLEGVRCSSLSSRPTQDTNTQPTIYLCLEEGFSRVASAARFLALFPALALLSLLDQTWVLLLVPTWALPLLLALSLLVELALLLELAWVVLELVLAWTFPLVLAWFVLLEPASMLELVWALLLVLAWALLLVLASHG